jgi:predicted N-acetyltransferase YhbS
MKLTKIKYTEADFIRVRDFLVQSHKQGSLHKNWQIDRWNFCRYMSQNMHNTFDSWPETVGFWIDESKKIAAVVNSEGENRGEAFFQLADLDFTDDMLKQFIEHAEKHLFASHVSGKLLNLRVNSDDHRLKELLKEREYTVLDWQETTSSLDIDCIYQIIIPDGFRLKEGTQVSDEQKASAHAKAFGYYNSDGTMGFDSISAFKSMRKAPDYDPLLDISVVDSNNEIAAFATVWYDRKNRTGILEPVGTVPQHRKQGLARALIFEGINRISVMGGKKIYVGSDQDFYLSLGFQPEHSKEIWYKKW